MAGRGPSGLLWLVPRQLRGAAALPPGPSALDPGNTERRLLNISNLRARTLHGMYGKKTVEGLRIKEYRFFFLIY